MGKMNYGVITGFPAWYVMADGHKEYLPDTTQYGHIVACDVDPIRPEDIKRSDITGLAEVGIFRKGERLVGIYGVYDLEAF